MFERPEGGDSALLVSLDFGERDYEDSTEELRLLATSAGAAVVGIVRGRFCQPPRMHSPHSAAADRGILPP